MYDTQKFYHYMTNSCLLHTRLTTDSSDAHVGDKFYHPSCSKRLQRPAAKTLWDVASCPAPPPTYDVIVMGTLIIFMSRVWWNILASAAPIHVHEENGGIGLANSTNQFHSVQRALSVAFPKWLEQLIRWKRCISK